MSKKVEVELIKMILKRRKEPVDPSNERDVNALIQEIQNEAAALEEGADEKEKKAKQQFVVVVYDPEGELEGKEFTGSVVQIPEDESVYTAIERLQRAGYEFNTTKKGRRMPVKTIGEICEHVPAKVLKEQKIAVKTKEPVFLLRTDGILPMEKSAAKVDKRKAE